jgi:c-di-GMP-binding flagellar brake protein YcgR
MSSVKTVIDCDDIDHSVLVGREIKIRSEQFPGRVLYSKVIGVIERNLVIDRTGSLGLINQLVGSQNVEVHLTYKGEPIVFSSQISKPKEGRIQIPLAKNIIPQVNRRFVRVGLCKDIRLTYFDNISISSARLNKLKWLETKTVNMCGGGMLVEIPANLSNDYYTILHLGFQEFEMPSLLVGGIRHSREGTKNLYYIGIEFIVNEDHIERLPKALIRNLPPKLFEFNERIREDLSVFLIEKYGQA